MRALEINLTKVISLKVKQWVGETNRAQFIEPGIPVGAADVQVCELVHSPRLTLANAKTREAGYIWLVRLRSSVDRAEVS